MKALKINVEIEEIIVEVDWSKQSYWTNMKVELSTRYVL